MAVNLEIMLACLCMLLPFLLGRLCSAERCPVSGCSKVYVEYTFKEDHYLYHTYLSANANGNLVCYMDSVNAVAYSGYSDWVMSFYGGQSCNEVDGLTFTNPSGLNAYGVRGLGSCFLKGYCKKGFGKCHVGIDLYICTESCGNKTGSISLSISSPVQSRSSPCKPIITNKFLGKDWTTWVNCCNQTASVEDETSTSNWSPSSRLFTNALIGNFNQTHEDNYFRN